VGYPLGVVGESGPEGVSGSRGLGTEAIVSRQAGPGPRTEPLVFGMALFLASEAMFFGALLSAYYFLRSETATWPPPGLRIDAVEPAIATLVLLASSGSAALAERAATNADPRRLRSWIAATLALGAVFVASQARTWLTDGFGIRSRAYGTIVYAMTGFHVMHVTAGLAVFLTVLAPASRAAARGERSPALIAATYYWHFVDVVWVVLFSTIYLVR
jgi:cytochrome c oxidase subunit III